MRNAIISDDPFETMNNVWITLEGMTASMERKAKNDGDLELKNYVLSLKNTSMALNHAQCRLEEERVSGVEQSTPS